MEKIRLEDQIDYVVQKRLFTVEPVSDRLNEFLNLDLSNFNFVLGNSLYILYDDIDFKPENFGEILKNARVSETSEEKTREKNGESKLKYRIFLPI